MIKKLFNWIFDKKQPEQEPEQKHVWTPYDQRRAAYNKMHGLPADQVIG